MKKVLLFVLFLVLFSSPIVLLLMISSQEVSSYTLTNVVNFTEKAYGDGVYPTRMTINETVDIDGVYEYSEVYFQDFNEYNYRDLYFMVETGDEVAVGDIVAIYDDIEITSDYDGLILNINAEENKTYIKYASFDNLRYKTYIPTSIDIDVGETYFTYEGVSLTAYSVSNIYSDGQREVVFISDTVNLLNEEKSYAFMTGKSYDNVLVLEKTCIYYNEILGTYQVRIIDDYGNILETRTITAMGDYDDDYAIVTGVSELERCDNAYGLLMGDMP